MRIPRNPKQFELTNHLGNVLSTVLDRKTPITATGGSGSSTTITHYEGDVVFATDYYPFGSPMSWSTPDSSGGRMYSGGGYRYGFNGQEKDDELGAGVTTAEFWMYDGKLGRRWNLDSKKIDKLLLKDERLKVISDLSGAKKSNGEELYIYYGTEGETKIGLEDPINRKEVADYYSNISTYTNKGNGENGYDIRAFVLTLHISSILIL